MSIIDSQARVLSNQWVNDEYKHMVVAVEQTASQVEPGQFFNLLCLSTDKDKPFFRRPMSTYFADPIKGQVEFLYKVVGTGTRGLAEVKENDVLPILGPLGKGFSLLDSDKHIVVLGRGVGLATLAPLAELAAAKGIKVTAILSAKDHNRLMSQHRFMRPQNDIIEVVDSDNSSAIENVEKIIREIHLRSPIDALFTCGSARIGKLLQKLSNELDIRGEAALEQHMACGIGLCHACFVAIKEHGVETLVSKKVCKDGPVFNIRNVVYE